jgi:hypothetical protein
MVFGIQTNQHLHDQVFCLTEERDYFQEKYLSQVSEIAFLKDELGQAKKEISKLRSEILQVQSPNHKQQQQQLDQSTSSLTSRDEEEEEEDEDEEEEEKEEEDCQGYETSDEQDKQAQDIRQSAEKLLQWASYRSSVRTASSTPDHSNSNSSVASPISASKQEEQGQPSQGQLLPVNMLGPIPSEITSFDQDEEVLSADEQRQPLNTGSGSGTGTSMLETFDALAT